MPARLAHEDRTVDEHPHVDEGLADLELGQDPDRDHDGPAPAKVPSVRPEVQAPLVALGDRQQEQQEGDAEG